MKDDDKHDKKPKFIKKKKYIHHHYQNTNTVAQSGLYYNLKLAKVFSSFLHHYIIISKPELVTRREEVRGHLSKSCYSEMNLQSPK